MYHELLQWIKCWYWNIVKWVDFDFFVIKFIHIKTHSCRYPWRMQFLSSVSFELALLYLILLLIFSLIISIYNISLLFWYEGRNYSIAYLMSDYERGYYMKRSPIISFLLFTAYTRTGGHGRVHCQGLSFKYHNDHHKHTDTYIHNYLLIDNLDWDLYLFFLIFLYFLNKTVCRFLFNISVSSYFIVREL